MTNNRKLVAVLIFTVLAGLGSGYGIEKYLGRNAGYIAGSVLFLSGIGLQTVQQARLGRRTP
jgi:hypothetical protein